VEAPAREDYPSARLQRLTQELHGGRSDALESFWREIEGKGPLVEEVAGNDRAIDVTFLWREIYDTRNVLLEWCPRTDDCYMSRLPGTEVWHKRSASVEEHEFPTRSRRTTGRRIAGRHDSSTR
jgi:hypothetical protein